MKRILILTTILIFACSSDDSSDTNDSSNQTFLERFDGVVWEPEGPVQAFQIIDNDNQSWKSVINGNCIVFYFGVINDNFEFGWDIILNEYDKLIVEKFDENDNIIGRNTLVPSEDGDVLTETYEDYSDNSEYMNTSYRTTLTDPCE